MKKKSKGGFEADVFSRWRRFLCYTQRAGVCKKAKRKWNKRFRKEGKDPDEV